MQRNISIDLLKLLLALSVVFLHTHIFYDFSALLGHSLVQGVFRLAVPVFLVITGYYFFYIDTLEKFKRWLTRIFILYAVWMVFYLPVWWVADAAYKFSVIYNGYFVLWYIIGVLLGGSLLYLLRNIGEKKLFATAAVLFALGTLIQQIGNLHLLDGYLDWKFNRYTTHR
ncbi:MAG: acyltransferase family protein, partial [Acinetobacter sp.]|nr:acyltransferase family protein [Acinetobacter sp.]